MLSRISSGRLTVGGDEEPLTCCGYAICPKDVKTSRYLLTYLHTCYDTLINQLILTKQFRLKVTLTVRDSIQSVETRSGGFGMIFTKYYFHATSFPGLLLSRHFTRKEIKGHGDEVDFDLKVLMTHNVFGNKRSENEFELSLITPVFHLPRDYLRNRL